MPTTLDMCNKRNVLTCRSFQKLNRNKKKKNVVQKHLVLKTREC